MATGSRGTLAAMMDASVSSAQEAISDVIEGRENTSGKEASDLTPIPDENEDDYDIDDAGGEEITLADTADLTDEEDEAKLREEPVTPDDGAGQDPAAPQPDGGLAPDPGQASTSPDGGQPQAEADEDADLVRLTSGQIRSKAHAVQALNTLAERAQGLEQLKGRMGAENGQLRSRVKLLESQIGLAMRMKSPDQLSAEEEKHYQALSERTGQSIEALLYLDQRDALKDFEGQVHRHEQAVQHSQAKTREYIERHPKIAEYEAEAMHLLNTGYGSIVGALQNSVPEQMQEASQKFIDLLFDKVELNRTRSELDRVRKEYDDLKNSQASRDEAIRRQAQDELKTQTTQKRVVAGSQAVRTSDRERSVPGPSQSGYGGNRDWLRRQVGE